MLSPHTGTSSFQKQQSHQTGIAALCALLGLFCAILCPFARTQTTGTGALAGGITDSSGASVPDAQIRMTSETRSASEN